MVKDTGSYYVPQEVNQTALFKERTNLIVGTEEVAQQYPLEKFS